MSARLVFISMLLIMGIVFYGVAYAGYRYYKKNTGEWEQEKAKLRKMSWLELILSGGAILLLTVVRLGRYFISGGDSLISALSFILVILVMALYIVVRRGGSVSVLMFTIISVLYVFFITIFIGTPQKAPVFAVDDTEITPSRTTATDLMEDGFDIYIRQAQVFGVEYSELISSGVFKKYPADHSVYIEKGFRKDNAAVEYSPYLLVKDGIVIGAVWFYGDEKKDIVLEDCSVIHIRLNEDSVKAIRENSIHCKLDGLDLIAPLEIENVKKTFGNKLRPIPDHPADITGMYYGLSWSSQGGVEHLFWNTYFSSISFDEKNNMTKFELSTELARDTDFL